MSNYSVIQLNDVDTFNDVADILVVGYGIAGACAALEARAAGADVLVIERASAGGGASALSSGLFYLGGGTEVQSACGYQDDAQNMYQFMVSSMGMDSADLIRRFCDNSVAHFDWLERQGVPFERSCYKDKAVFLLGTEGLLSTGNEKVWPYRELANPVPRGHQVTGEGESTGNAAMTPLLARCKQLGVRELCDTKVESLVVDSDGSVCGVKTVSSGEARYIKARKAVIMATGGFAMNSELVKHYLPMLGETVEPLGAAYTDGSGIVMAEQCGALTEAMDKFIATASIYPPGQLIKGIIVNKYGQRFVAEDSYHGRTAEFISNQPDQRAFLIVDAEIFVYPEIESARHELIDGFETISEMEAALNMPEGSLVGTLERYNQFAADGFDPDLFKDSDWIKPLDQGPYAVFDISFNRSIYLFMTLGGLKTNQHAQVLNLNKEPIPGLYAAGACSVHIPKSGASYASGMSLGPGSYFGRVAGHHASQLSTRG